jgi:hypothetical protein
LAYTPDGGPLPLEIIFKIKRDFNLVEEKLKQKQEHNDIF